MKTCRVLPIRNYPREQILQITGARHTSSQRRYIQGSTSRRRNYSIIRIECQPLSYAREADVYLRSNGLDFAEPLQVGLVHLLKILHVGQEDI